VDGIATGDLVFVHPPFDPKEEVDNAILATGLATVQWLQQQGVNASNETVSHVALAWRHPSDNSLFFVQAIPPKVVITAESDFLHSCNTYYHGVIQDATVRRAIGDAVSIARKQVGKPYADDFQAPPDTFYCSSLVEFAFDQALQTSGIFGPADFQLIFVPLPFWVKYYAAMGLSLPTNTTGSNPTLQLHSPLLKFNELHVEQAAQPCKSGCLYDTDDSKTVQDDSKTVQDDSRTVPGI
jgi:hypothetical protein